MTALVSGVDRLCPYGGSPPCLPSLQSYSLGIGIFCRLAGFGLQFGCGFLDVVFLRVLGIVIVWLWGGLLA